MGKKIHQPQHTGHGNLVVLCGIWPYPRYKPELKLKLSVLLLVTTAARVIFY